MSLTRQQEQQFDNHLEQVALTTARTVICPVCGVSAFHLAGITEGGPKVAPMAQAVCKTCGCVLLFDCRVAGITI